jgi:formylglycine-generating enzyme required for sulfatase activity
MRNSPDRYVVAVILALALALCLAATNTATANDAPQTDSALGGSHIFIPGVSYAPNTAAEVLIPAGTFQMGCDSANDSNCQVNESPIHTVHLNAYRIDKYEVTNARYKACVDAGVCIAPGGTDSWTHDFYFGNAEFADYPVISVAWSQAAAFCAWEGKRLPTEAEWEMAARGSSNRVYAWGNQAPDCSRGNFYLLGPYKDCGDHDTAWVGSYPAGASPYGMMDMPGNVEEWVNDGYDPDYYKHSPSNNPPGAASGFWRVARGGSFLDSAENSRATHREFHDANWSYPTLGFRCAR